MAKALVIVDMLHDFVDENGSLPVSGAKSIIENIGKVKGTAGNYKVLVAYANDAHTEEDKDHLEKWPVHAMKGTYGAEVIDELAVEETDLVIEKRDNSMFINPSADTQLKAKGIDELYVTGVATEYCVREAVLGALERGYTVNLIEDAIAGVELQKGDIHRALTEMKQAGARFITTSQALDEIVR